MNGKKTDNGRRNFVKTGATAIAGGALLSSFPMKAFGAGQQKEIRIGLVGCGGRGTGAAHEALKTSKAVKLVALGEVFEDRLNSAYQNLKNTYGNQVEVPDSKKFIGFDAYQKVIESCDVVLLATPPPFRPLHLEAAVKADKHVFIEKPLFVDIPGYHKVMGINELAKQKNLNLGVGLQLRYENGYQKMKEQIDSGMIGDITSLDVYYNVGAPKIHPRQPGQTEMNYQVRNWRYFTWLWGGQLAGQTIHQIDLINWFMNDYPEVAQGLGGRQSFNGPDQGNTYDHHYAEFEYSNKIKLHVQSKTMDNTWNKVGFHIQGTKGYANEKSEIYNTANEPIWRYRDQEETVGPTQKCQSDFINSIINNKPLNQVDYGAKSTLTTIVGRMAIHSGQIITVEEALKSKKSILPKEFNWDAEMPSMPGPDGNYSIPVPGKVEVL
ncbi:Gfo/Idh/MocA family protein [Kriegella aquimaris]|uniref:Predicted dehydrogenase n=1 Tax=Kriegella aquimaris TaxID=192904 RepID=A0A1G9S7H8_9FLAO|nr:Gfo/Idh/MocA family oxidoreductase [Kriegella aquimaris]SDM31280.1 Predicted dehydrogenase [Kriegella aquimaris]